jgi:hypothetical protein
LNLGGQIQHQTAEARCGSGTAGEANTLHELGVDSNTDSCATTALTGSAAREHSSRQHMATPFDVDPLSTAWHFSRRHVDASPGGELRLQLPERCVATGFDADSPSNGVSGMDAREMTSGHQVTTSASSGLILGSSTPELGLPSSSLVQEL